MKPVLKPPETKQVEPMKPVLKPPETKHLKQGYDKLLSGFAFNCNLRHYTLVTFVTLLHFYAAPYESSNLDNMMSAALGTEFIVLFSGRGAHSSTFLLNVTCCGIRLLVYTGARAKAWSSL